MRRWLLLAALAVGIAALAGCSAQDAIRINWEVSLPAGGRLAYQADSGPSFHGDGVRFHVFRYDGEIGPFLDWGEPSAEAAEAADGLLDEIGVPEGERADFAACPVWQASQPQDHRSRIYIFLDGTSLYVVESFF